MLARAKGTSSLPLSHSFLSHPAILNNLAHIFEQISRSPSPWRHLHLRLTFQTRDAGEWLKSSIFEFFRDQKKKNENSQSRRRNGGSEHTHSLQDAVPCLSSQQSPAKGRHGQKKQSFCATTDD